jgi:endogenous inhibitor of DNA gyrase (YacG/DUF329 family)
VGKTFRETAKAQGAEEGTFLIEVKCDYCGKRISRYLSSLSDHNFCSHKCFGRWHGKREKGENNPRWKEKASLNCEYCGEKITRLSSRINSHNFCSRTCVARWKAENVGGGNNSNWRGGKVSIKCAYCGKKFEVDPYRKYDARFCSERCFGKWMSQHNPSYGGLSDSHRGKISIALQNYYSSHPHPITYPKPYYVDKLGHSVRSKWEEEIGLLLKANGIIYGYEARTFKFNGTSYTPDFIVGGNVIEVKGPFYNWHKKKYKEFNEAFPELNYIMVGSGSEEVCDIHIPWKERERLVEILEEGILDDSSHH